MPRNLRVRLRRQPLRRRRRRVRRAARGYKQGCTRMTTLAACCRVPRRGCELGTPHRSSMLLQLSTIKLAASIAGGRRFRSTCKRRVERRKLRWFRIERQGSVCIERWSEYAAARHLHGSRRCGEIRGTFKRKLLLAEHTTLHTCRHSSPHAVRRLAYNASSYGPHRRSCTRSECCTA